jgi:hypothetical protein
MKTDKQTTPEQSTMYTTSDERGILNNFATEPKMYYADAPNPREQRNYAIQGIFAALFVSLCVTTAFFVS